MQPHTVFVHDVVMDNALGRIQSADTGSKIAVLLCIGDVAVNVQPLLGHPLAGPSVPGTIGILNQIAASQNLICKDIMVSADGLFAVNSFSGIGVKIIVVSPTAVGIVERAPSGFQRAVDRVVGIAVQFKQTCYLALRYAVLSEVVVIAVLFILIARDLANTSHRYVINEVVEIISGLSPALPTGLVQGKAVFKCGVGGPEVGALLAGIVGVDEGIKTIGLLNTGVAGNGIQCAGAQIDVIAHFTGIFNGQAFIFIPLCVCLGRCLDPAEDTDGVGRCRVDRLGLVDPVADYSQRMGLFIEFRAGHGEIFVHQSHFGEVKLEIGVNMELHPYLSQHTDSLCQLQQEVPGRSIGRITARKQCDQRFDLLRDLDLFHIKSEDIGNIHLLIGIGNMVILVVCCGRVGDISVPCKGFVSLGSIVKVKNGFAIFIERDFNIRMDGKIFCQRGCDRYCAHAGFLIADECKTIKSSRIGAAQFKAYVIGIDGYFVAVISGN